MQLEKLGTVHSCFKEKFGTPRQAKLVKDARGYIEVDQKWEPEKCLKGLEDFSHAWVLFWFHANKNSLYRPVIRPPRLALKRVGALASRSPMRPNPIGLSLVKIDKVEGARIYISGLDIIDNTPVLDIKPYIHSYDSVATSSSAWVDSLEDAQLEVEFTEQALTQIHAHPNPDLQQAIRDILQSDIRNRNDKREKREAKQLGFYFEDLNIVFRVLDRKATVLYIEPSHNHGGTKASERTF